jgi:ABC-type branched-subunit amino acid transport system substrate-binding protein
MRSTSRPLAAAMLTLSLLLSACGARLSDEQLEAAVSQSGRAGGTGTGTGVGTDPALSGTDPALDPAATGGGGPVDTAGTATTDGGPAPAAQPGDPAMPAAGGGGGGGGGGRPADTRAAPPGGNGGATDIGVTADAITIANASDISGAVPGLFEDAQNATKAYVAYFTALEGTIYGRRLNLLNLDTRLDTGANRSAALQMCKEAFAGVGSVSAFDQGAAPVIEDCGIPDMRGLPATNQMKAVPNTYGTLPGGQPGIRSMGQYGWAAEKFPDAVKKAGYLYIDGEVTRQLAREDIKAAEATLGYDFIYEGAIGITETNYTPFIQAMKQQGVRYVTFVGAYQQAASIRKTMRQQGFEPDVWQPTVTAYTPEYLSSTGPAAEGTYVSVRPALLEEIANNRELQLYAQFLDQVAPGAKPTAIGQYAWASAALFVQLAKEIGPNLTRKAMLDKLAGVRDFTGNGLFPPTDVGLKTLDDCTAIVVVQGGKFVRFTPTEVGGLRCGDGVVDSRTGEVVRRGA